MSGMRDPSLGRSAWCFSREWVAKDYTVQRGLWFHFVSVAELPVVAAWTLTGFLRLSSVPTARHRGIGLQTCRLPCHR